MTDDSPLCVICGDRGFHAHGCSIAGGGGIGVVRDADEGYVAPVENYPVGYPRLHPNDSLDCPACVDGIAHVGLFADRKRDPNRVLFLEVRALWPGKCLVVARERDVDRAVRRFGELTDFVRVAWGGRAKAFPRRPLPWWAWLFPVGMLLAIAAFGLILRACAG